MPDLLKVSAVIRVRNNADDLRRCLTGFHQQRLPAHIELELIVVDNESTDASADVAREMSAKVVPISTALFTWGRALNYGIREASGSLIVILSSDAYPTNENWLFEMIRPFEDASVAAVYGRQISRSDAPVDEQIRLKKQFREESRSVNSIPENFSADGGDLCVSNACAAIRRTLWNALPYDEEVAGGEEGIWTYEHLKQGYTIMYQATACVYHSHKDSILRHSWRIWELLQKSARLNKKTIHAGSILRASLALTKRRIINCCYPGVSFRGRVMGILRIPFEILALFSIALVDRKGANIASIRSFYWDSKF